MERRAFQETVRTDPERVVVECCAAGTPAVMTFHGGGTGLRAVFSGFRSERVEFEMTDDPPERPEEGGLCNVSFLHRGSPFNFSAAVQETGRERDRWRIRLAVPGQIASEAMRSAFRIPGGPGINSVDIAGDDGVTWHGELINLSLTGMLIRFAGDGPTLLPDQAVELSVKVVDEHVHLAGVVRRVESDGVGLFFPDSVSDSPENPIRCAVAALERDWHARLRR